MYGPFEAGFGEQQNSILEALGCADGNDGHVIGGIDTATAEQMVAHQCSIILPRIVGDEYISLLDECGGHTNEYHFHERMSCLYDTATSGHSVQIALGTDDKGLHGKWESQPTDPHNLSTGTLPVLDACGGHLGITPDSDGAEVYHYHVQDGPPFTIGCYGPAADGGMVSVAECRGLYDGCGDNDEVQITTPAGTFAYDPWCPCWDEHGSNVEPTVQQPVPTPTTSADTETTEPSDLETGMGAEETRAAVDENDLVSDATDVYASAGSGTNVSKASSALVAGTSANAAGEWLPVMCLALLCLWQSTV